MIIDIVKNNDYDAVWCRERSTKLCGAHDNVMPSAFAKVGRGGSVVRARD